MSKPVLELHNVSKSFDGVTVLRGVDLCLCQGEIHGLVGQNGSGKSTLAKILGGVHVPDVGSRAWIRGDPVAWSARSPQRDGVVVIHQDLGLVESMSVADNVGIATGFERPLMAAIHRSRERSIVRSLADRVGVSLDPDQLVGDLSPAERSVVAILRGLRQLGEGEQAHLMVLDEPTATLPRAEASRLLELLRGIAAKGTAVLYVSHRISEVLSICDRVSVLRSGDLVATLDSAGCDESEIVHLMLGYALDEVYPEKSFAATDSVRLEVRELSGGSVFEVSFDVGVGEILGITGLAGMGQDQIPYLIVDGRHRSGGDVRVDGVAMDGSSGAARRAGVELVPGNRQRDALWLGGTAAENLTLPSLGRLWRGLRLSPERETEFAESEMRRFLVRPHSPTLGITKFSGGNQQKIVFARALGQAPSVLLLHEPTQGVDAEAKKEILDLVRRAAVGGAAVLVFSSDIEEVAQLCHRVMIMRYGVVSAVLEPGDVSESQILARSQSSQEMQARSVDAA